MKSLRVVAVVLSLALCAALALAAPAWAATGEIEGRVTKEEEGEIEGAAPVEVCALSVVSGGPEICALDEGDGDYKIENVPSGEYKVLFEPVFSPPEGSKFVPQYYREKVSFASAETVEVESGLTTEDISVQLQIGGAISGMVTDLLGEPLEGVEVCAYDEAAPEFQYFCNETVANGTYEILGLPIATAYRVIFNPEEVDPYYPTRFFNEKPSLAEADHVDVTTPYEKAEDVIPNINAKLEPRVAIEGTVSEAGSGAGLEKIRVCALNSSTEAEVGCDESGRGGGYAILGLPAGSYVVAFAVPDAGGGGGGFQRQYYEGKSSFAEAGRISALRAGVYRGIDAHLVKSPPASSPPPVVVPTTSKRMERPPHCRKHFRRKRIKGHPRCVRAKPKRHHHRHRRGSHGAMKGR